MIVPPARRRSLRQADGRSLRALYGDLVAGHPYRNWAYATMKNPRGSRTAQGVGRSTLLLQYAQGAKVARLLGAIGHHRRKLISDVRPERADSPDVVGVGRPVIVAKMRWIRPPPHPCRSFARKPDEIRRMPNLDLATPEGQSACCEQPPSRAAAVPLRLRTGAAPSGLAANKQTSGSDQQSHRQSPLPPSNVAGGKRSRTTARSASRRLGIPKRWAHSRTRLCWRKYCPPSTLRAAEFKSITYNAMQETV
ncbi:hypothetical protein ACVWW6_008798 [Bradyrhizobium sp. USDA 3311]